MKRVTKKYWKENKIEIDNKQEIHKKRCDNDPIYKVLFSNDVDYLHNLLENGIAYVNKLYGKKFRTNKNIQYLFELVLNKSFNDLLFKRIVLFFLLSWEQPFCKTIGNTYGNEGLFGKNGKDHFQVFVMTVDKFVEQTLCHPFDENNIMEMLQNLEHAIRESYMMY